ncbi:MAG TPA: glycosyl hydrolase family 65 protein, partial [Thermoanaerobaculia bacterium]|nr:glycosyl hydrolase family 65 protein [Thermoanaerobaculia bacterium]
RLRGAALHVDPCVPRAWCGYRLTFRYHSSRYELVVENPHGATCGVASVEVDAMLLPGGAREIPLTDDGRTHRIRVVLGATEDPGRETGNGKR